MYLGKLVELAPVEQLYADPRHPYTVALLSAVPDARPAAAQRGASCSRATCRSPANPPSGCRFHTRCWLREQLGNPENCVDRGARRCGRSSQGSWRRATSDRISPTRSPRRMRSSRWSSADTGMEARTHGAAADLERQTGPLATRAPSPHASARHGRRCELVLRSRCRASSTSGRRRRRGSRRPVGL